MFLKGMIMKRRIIPMAFLAITLFTTSACANPVRNAIFQPPTKALSLDELTPDAKFIEVETADKLKLKGIYVPPKGDKPILLVFHGNASSARGVLKYMRHITDAGFGVISTEWRGYSQNPGKPTQKGVAMDADAFYQYAKSIAGDRKIIVFGHSLGGAVALDLALRNKLDMVVTYGTFYNVDAFVPFYGKMLIADPFDNAKAVTKLDEPYVLVHGLEDETIPVAHGAMLEDNAKKANIAMDAVFVTSGKHSFDDTQILQILEKISLENNALHFNHQNKFDFEGDRPIIKKAK